jgi:hypothetical protein
MRGCVMRSRTIFPQAASSEQILAIVAIIGRLVTPEKTGAFSGCVTGKDKAAAP